MDNIGLPECFGELIFTTTKMKKYLSKKYFDNFIYAVETSQPLDLKTADEVANAMKDWAVENGATHYTHWFEPLTEGTAEKRNSFIAKPVDGKVIVEFSGKELIKGEVDASSLPNGGVRTTFEARGYTQWDITSPVFIKRDETGITLCIPTAYVAYGGQALDGKTPLLRSMDALSEQAVRLVRLFGNKKTKRVNAFLGVEQEYFLIDRDLYLRREDLIQTGRTLFGERPPKCQQLGDHYYSVIRSRIGEFMDELNFELWKMGVPAKTHHNEAAPAQHELACIYENANIAVDHNQLVMDTMKKIASRYNLECLLHEKPFRYVNGSGKHNNWSIETEEGEKLLRPGKDPHENKQFLLVLSCILKAVDNYSEQLRASVASVGNDHRLGKTEAPPAIISVFLGEQLEDVINQIVEKGFASSSKQNSTLSIVPNTLPEIVKDVTDRNRTSPFAYTGNKFEFRMPGSSASCSLPVTVINTIVAKTFKEACDELEQAKDFDKELLSYIRKTFKEHKKIIFGGNGYSNEWKNASEKRGLKNIDNMVDAIPYINCKKTVELFSEFNVFSKEELDLRSEIEYDKYISCISIEAQTMLRMVRKQYLPIMFAYSQMLADTIKSLNSIKADASVESDSISSLIKAKKNIKKYLEKLEKELDKNALILDNHKRAEHLRDNVSPIMEMLRQSIDFAEQYVDKDAWPVPSYADMLFEVSAF